MMDALQLAGAGMFIFFMGFCLGLLLWPYLIGFK